MKAIMLSDQPKWVEKISNGEKKIEVRERFPSDYVGWVYIYCTKGKPYLYRFSIDDRYSLYPYKSEKLAQQYDDFKCFNGKVVARFWCDKVEEIYKAGDTCHFTNKLSGQSLIQFSKLSEEELENYLGYGGNKIEVCGYAIHISQLEIFDKPKELSEFYKIRCKNVDENNDCLYCNNNRHCPFAEIDYNPDDSINAYICGEHKKPLTRAPQGWQYIEVEE